MLKILGRTSSSNVQKVLWCCDELGESYERVDVGGEFGGTKEPGYLAKNPNARVPTVEENGLVIWESHTILRYLAKTRAAGERLYPRDPGACTYVERWMDWALAHLNGPMTVLHQAFYRTAPDKRDPAAIERARATAADTWSIVERHLAQGTPYLGGDDFTLADIPIGIFARRWHGYSIERPVLPHVAAWYERISKRPGFVAHIAGPLT